MIIFVFIDLGMFKYFLLILNEFMLFPFVNIGFWDSYMEHVELFTHFINKVLFLFCFFVFDHFMDLSSLCDVILQRFVIVESVTLIV